MNTKNILQLENGATIPFDAEAERNNIVRWCQKWFEAHAKYGDNAFIGISGGKDSTIAAAILARALGKNRVIGILMPDCKQSDIEDAYGVVRALGIRSVVLNIGPMSHALYAGIASATDCDNNHLGLEAAENTIINTPPRMRMTTLYGLIPPTEGNGYVVNTCNRSENHIGYDTKFGDGAGDMSPLSDYTVTELIAIGLTMPEIPEHLVLKTPADGLCFKTDEERFGFSYQTLDTYLLTGVISDMNVKAKIDAMHQAALHKLRPMPVCPRRKNRILEEPFTEKEIRRLLETGTYHVSHIVRVKLADIINRDFEELMDMLSKKITGSDLLMNIRYTMVKPEDIGADTNKDEILLRVDGNISECLID